MPIFNEEFDDSFLFGYFDSDKLVAFTMVSLLNNKNAYSDQFAWNYHNPQLRLGIRSIENECAILKEMGYDYYYLGTHDEYKTRFDGYEITGPLSKP
jgi:arginyl-tRNA--protein-N-Asp/Glu arginylyltransferase